MICTKCGEDKPETEFYKRKENKSGHEYQCKICRKISRLVSKEELPVAIYAPV